MADPLIVHWPKRLGDGGTRHQYVHAIDVMPTLLDLIGIEPPAVDRRHRADADRGRELRARRSPTPARRAAHVTQYYEMLGSRALYHDGWKAVVFHPTPFIAYDGTDVSKPFDDDVWELYHVAEDFSEVDDLAEKEPEQLERDEGAVVGGGGQVPGAARSTTSRAGSPTGGCRRERYEFYPGIGPLPEAIAPNLRNRGFALTATLDVPADGAGRGRDRRPRQPLRRLRRLPARTGACTSPTTSSAPRSPSCPPSVRAAGRRGGGEGRGHPGGDRHLRRRRCSTATCPWARAQIAAAHAGHLRDDRLRRRLPARRRRSARRSTGGPRSPPACSARS